LPAFVIPFYVGSGSKSGSGTGTVMHSGSGYAKTKVRFYTDDVREYFFKGLLSDALTVRQFLFLASI
jgi:hypothetical protein